MHLGAAHAEHEQRRDGQHVEDERGEDDVVQQLAVRTGQGEERAREAQADPAPSTAPLRWGLAPSHSSANALTVSTRACTRIGFTT